MKSGSRFHVSTFGLAPDLQRVHPAFGKINRGDVSAQRLREALEMYGRLGSPEVLPLSSHFEIQGDTGRFLVRLAGTQLTLAAEGESPAQGVPLTAAEIVTRLTAPPAATPIFSPPRPPPPETWWRSALALVLPVVGVVLIVVTLKPFFSSGPAEAPENISLLTDAALRQSQQAALAGLFVTGQQPGDRHITISPNGTILFAELGPRTTLGHASDTFRIGRREQRTCLVTMRNGIIDVINANTLVYYDDTYLRLK